MSLSASFWQFQLDLTLSVQAVRRVAVQWASPAWTASGESATITAWTAARVKSARETSPRAAAWPSTRGTAASTVSLWQGSLALVLLEAWSNAALGPISFSRADGSQQTNPSWPRWVATPCWLSRRAQLLAFRGIFKTTWHDNFGLHCKPCTLSLLPQTVGFRV